MERKDLTELHYITHIGNVPSILQLGIVSHNRAESLKHVSVADPEIQERRSKVTVPQGLNLHDYVNLYFSARNPMLYKRLEHYQEICVLQVNSDVLDLQGTVVTDGNASSDWVRFEEAPKGLEIVVQELTYSDDWRDTNHYEYLRKKSAKCAEVLVPDRVAPSLVTGIYVSCDESKANLNDLVTNIYITVNEHMFFK